LFKQLKMYEAYDGRSFRCMELRRNEVPDAHYLETHSFCWHAVHVLCSAETLVLLRVLLQRKNENLC
jgi:hypothetical protein